MPNFENNILGLIPQDEWLDVGFEVTRQNDPIDSLFGDDRTDNLMARWQSIASEYQIPVMAQFHGFDTEAKTTFRVPVDNHNIEKGLIKVKINQSERMRALTRSGVRNDEMYDYVLNDGIRLADQVVTRTKVAKNELMATGKITIKENNLDLTVDYGVPTSQSQFVISFDDDANVPAQIQYIIDSAIDAGVTLNGIITSKANITKMRNHKSVQIAINGVNSTGAMVKMSALESYLEEEFGITRVVVNDLKYVSEAKIGEDGRPVMTTKRYFPENKISFFSTNPSGRMGIGLWGNPPEVDNGQLMQSNASGISPYVYITQKMEWDPAVLWTKASGLFMPVLYNPNSLFIATVGDNYLDKPTITPVGQSTDFWGTLASSIQSADTAITNGKATGTLYKQTSGQIVTDWGEGYFIGLGWSGIDANANSVKVGLIPSVSSGLVEAVNDPDKNGVFKISNKNIQTFNVIVSDGAHSRVETIDLSGLTLQES